jgi:hypothetical protein
MNIKRLSYTVAAVLVSGLTMVSLSIPQAYAGCSSIFNCPDLDPTDSRSPLNPGNIRESIPAPSVPQLQYDSFSILNRCNKILNVTVEIKPLNANRWVTNNYVFSPGERGLIDRTSNRYVYVSARSTDGSFTWQRKQIDMGPNLGVNYTYNLTCGG